MEKKNNFSFAYELSESANGTAEILIYSEIVSLKWRKEDPEITASEFNELMNKAKESGAKKLKLRINSPGGSVWQAVAMKTMVETSEFEEIDVDIEGLCASAATFFSCIAGAKVRIAEGSSFMIHNPSAGIWGTANAMRKAAERLEKIQEGQYGMYAAKSGQTEEQIKEWMDAETWFTAKEAVESGFADEIIQSAAIAACVSEDSMDIMREMYEHIPEEIGVSQKQTPQKEVGIAPASGGASEYTTPNEEGNENMEIKDITAEQLRQENPELYNSLVTQGITGERSRMQEIDELTDKGFEDLAQKAKNEGTSAADFLKQVVAERKKRSADFLKQRHEETGPAQKVTGGASGDNDGPTEDEEIKQNAKDMAAFANELYGESSGSMF